MTNDVRFGLLGAARITPKALVEPALSIDQVRLTRVAARDEDRAREFATEHQVENVAGDYRAVVEADDVDVVYNPLPMSLHCEWTIAALRAGKHVLCEKPFASNATEAERMVAVAAETGLVLGEAFHYRYHPLFARVLAEVANGTIGDLVRVEGDFAIRIPEPDIRWSWESSGGSLMDLGCYPVHWLRSVVGAEPEVVAATAEVGPPAIDATITAELAFPGGVTGSVHSSMVTDEPVIELRITGTAGEMVVSNPLAPQNGNNLMIRTGSGETSGTVDAGNTYVHMLRAFVDHLVHGSPYPTAGQDSIDNMVVIDSIYEAAGLPIRGT